MNEPSNHQRACAAHNAVETFSEETGIQDCSMDSKIGDLLANIMHLCADVEVCFEATLAMARSHFESEREDEEIEAWDCG